MRLGITLPFRVCVIALVFIILSMSSSLTPISLPHSLGVNLRIEFPVGALSYLLIL